MLIFITRGKTKQSSASAPIKQAGCGERKVLRFSSHKYVQAAWMGLIFRHTFGTAAAKRSGGTYAPLYFELSDLTSE
jgi:hypothetical protein